MRVGAAHKARTLRRQGALAVLRQVHARPGVTRAELARTLGLSSGSATEITGRLKALRLLREAEAPATGGRGRPSPALAAHPDGPLVCAVDISHERWRVATVELGGRLVADAGGRHRERSPEGVLPVLRRRIAQLHRDRGHRLRAVSVAIAGTVRGTRVVQASNLGWREVDLDPLRPAPGVALLVGNDASLGGLAEARRGAGAGTSVVLHLTIEVGIGGVLVVDGQVMTGATGAGGEFGHMPFGDPARPCPCGARGCWDLEVDGRAMARILGQPPPADPRTTADRVLAATLAGDLDAGEAVTAVTAALGRGIAALVNALDPEVVTLSGLAAGLAGAAGPELRSSYQQGLMRFRRADPPPLRTTTLGTEGTLTGAAEVAFDTVLTDTGLDAWSSLSP